MSDHRRGSSSFAPGSGRQLRRLVRVDDGEIVAVLAGFDIDELVIDEMLLVAQGQTAKPHREASMEPERGIVWREPRFSLERFSSLIPASTQLGIRRAPLSRAGRNRELVNGAASNALSAL